MAINFPNSPTDGQSFTSGSTTWTYDASAGVWNVLSSGGSGGAGGNAFGTIAVATQDNVVADASPDTLTLVAGSGITLTTNAGTDTVTIATGGASASFATIAADTGTATADSAADTLTITGGTHITTAANSSTDSVDINLAPFGVSFLTDVDTTSTPPTAGQVLKWNGSAWVPGTDVTSGGGGTDADTLDGFDSSYFLNYNNLNNTPTVLTLSALSVGPENTAAGNGAISYSNTTGVFTFTPPDLSGYLTEVPATRDWGTITNKPTTISGYGITDAFDGAFSSLLATPTTLSGYGITDALSNTTNLADLNNVAATSPSSGQVLTWDGAQWGPDTVSGGGGDVNQNAFSNIAVSGQTTVSADSTTDTFTLAAGSNITITTNATSDTITIASTGGGSSSFSSLTDASNAGLNISEVYLPAITSLVVTANGASSYRFDQYGTTDNPTVYAICGTTIAFDLQGVSASHPFEIQTGAGAAYNEGLYHVATDGTVTTGSSANAKTGGVLYWKIPASISGGYRYQCTSHGAMVGSIQIKNIATI